MVDRRLIARLDAARVSFCLVGGPAVPGPWSREGDVELLAVDDAVLRPLFWDGAPAPVAQLGGPGDLDLGTLSWDDLAPPHHLRVGRSHAAVFTVDMARPRPELGCRVATSLGLVLLALERGGPRSRADVVELVRAQEARFDRPWRPGVAGHLEHMAPAARATWHQAELDLGAPA